MATLVTERYEIQQKVGKERVIIFVEISKEDEVTIQTIDKKPQFTFTRCNKDLVMAMGQAIQEAAQLVESRKIKAA